jgi:hypothetical protein
MDGPCEVDGMLAILRHDPAQAAVDDIKTVATLQARAALAGFELIQLADGTFIGSKSLWAMHACLADVAAVEAWLVRVGAPA